jgi:hypothetical protein
MRSQNKHQTDAQCGSKNKHIPSSKLPFEKIPEGHDLHHVSFILPTELSFLRTSYEATSKNDLYTQSGDQDEAFTSPDIHADIEIWSARLSLLTTMHYRTTKDDKIPDLQFDFFGIRPISENDGCDAATSWFL